MPALERRPELYQDLELVWHAFFELHRARSVGFDYVSLVPSEIQAWLSLHGITDLEEQIEVFELVNILDIEWLSWKQEKRGTDADSMGSN